MEVVNTCEKCSELEYKKCRSDTSALMEKSYIAAKREIYLKTIIDNRNLPPELRTDIIYLDERRTIILILKMLAVC